MLLAQHPDWVCLSADARNAYNSISRAAIVDALHELLPELVPWCEVCYGQHSRLVLRMAGGAEIVLSRRGVRQGDPLGPLLFALPLEEPGSEWRYALVEQQADSFIRRRIDHAVFDIKGCAEQPSHAKDSWSRHS